MENIVEPVIDRDAFFDILDILDSAQWTNDLRHELMDLWDLCNLPDERSLLKELINDFFVLDTRKAQQACDGINEYINSLNEEPSSSYIVAVADVGKSDGSLAGLQMLRQRNKPTEDWESQYISHIPDLIEKVVNPSNIFIFDDFIGSGNKIILKYRWLLKCLSEKKVSIDEYNISIISFSAMAFGITNIEKTLGIQVYTYNTFHKSITGKNAPSVSKNKIDIMLRIEKKLNANYNNRKLEKYSLGFNQSEALYYWEGYSCPNNVFPIFWWPNLKNNGTYRTILTRTN